MCLHLDHELLWTGGGTVTVEAAGDLWAVPPVLGIWIPAGVAHHVHAHSGSTIHATSFRPEMVPSKSERRRRPHHDCPTRPYSVN